MRPTLIFDVNETLLDLRALDEPFAAGFGDAAARREWFGQLLQLAFVAVLTDRYAPFDELGRRALAMTEQRRSVQVSDVQRLRIEQRQRELPAHADAPAALRRLHEAGFALHALTNSTAPACEAQLDHAGLRALFASVQSADASESYKPEPTVYRDALMRLGVAPEHALMVAAHGWDVAGAAACGMRTAFVAREGAVLDPAQPPPELVVPDLGALADRLIFFPATALPPR